VNHPYRAALIKRLLNQTVLDPSEDSEIKSLVVQIGDRTPTSARPAPARLVARPRSAAQRQRWLGPGPPTQWWS